MKLAAKEMALVERVAGKDIAHTFTYAEVSELLVEAYDVGFDEGNEYGYQSGTEDAQESVYSRRRA